MTDDEDAEEQNSLFVITEEGTRKRESRINRERHEGEKFWRAVLADPVGRRELWRLIAVGSHAFETRFMSGQVGFPDANATWYARGEQESGLRFYHYLANIDRAGILLMHDEHDPRFAKPKRRKAG